MEHSMEQRNSALTRRIMRRVYVVAAIRYMLHPVFLKSLITFVFFWRSTAYVSYPHVIANAPSLFDLKRDINFYGSALQHAEATTLALLLAVGVLLLWITYDMASKRSHAWL
jgi:hypothetical protein